MCSSDLPGVVRIDEAYRLRGAGTTKSGDKVRLFAVRGEKLEPIPRELFPIVTHVVRPDLMAYEYDMWEGDRKKFRLSDKLKAFQDEECQAAKDTAPGGKWRGYYNPSVDTCKRVARDIENIFESLARRNIRWRDAHHKNVGVDSTGRMKALDLGVRTSPGGADIAPLEGGLGKSKGGKPKGAFSGLGARWKLRGRRR